MYVHTTGQVNFFMTYTVHTYIHVWCMVIKHTHTCIYIHVYISIHLCTYNMYICIFVHVRMCMRVHAMPMLLAYAYTHISLCTYLDISQFLNESRKTTRRRFPAKNGSFFHQNRHYFKLGLHHLHRK